MADKEIDIDSLPIIPRESATAIDINSLPIIPRGQAQPQQPQSLNAQYGKRDDWLGTLGRLGVHTSNALRTVGQGITMNAGDEIEAGVRSVLTDESYDDSLKRIRAGIDKTESDHPVTATLGQMASGFAIPGLAFKNAGNLSKLGRIGRATLTGTVTAAPDGFFGGRDGFSDRAANAIVSGTIGGVGGGAFGALVEALGMAGKIGGTALKKADPGVKTVARRLANVPPRIIDEGVEAAKRAKASGTPQFVPELLNDPDAYDFARALRNDTGSNRIAEDALRLRDETLMGDIRKGLSKHISSEVDSSKAGKAIKRAAKEYVEAGNERKFNAVEKLYNEGYEAAPSINDTGVDRILKSSRNNDLKRKINKLRELPRFADLPDNSTKLLHNAVSELEADAQKVGGVEGKNVREFLAPVRQALKNSSPEFAKADRRYARFSRAMEDVEESLIGKLARTKTANHSQIAKEVVGTKAKELKALKRSFKGKEDELKALLRSYYEDILKSTPRKLNSVNKQNPLPKIAATEYQHEVINEILGEAEGTKLIKFLEDQDRMLEGRKLYHKGASTHSNFKQQGLADAAMRTIDWARNKTGNAFDVLEESLGMDVIGRREDAARVMFNPDGAANVRALEQLKEIQPIISGSPEAKALFDALGVQGFRTVADKRDEIPHLFITPPKR